MIRLLKWGAILLFLFVILIPVSIWGYVSYQLNSIENQTIDQLLHEGYFDEEMMAVEGTFKYGLGFTAEVYFKDEPHVNYNYIKRGEEIINSGPYETLEAYSPEPKRFTQ
ncbi:DUF3139 domain-containing protein [Alkalicoccobacillus plakortidis]|uniref:DUF3139 domain-containing protein n=1 Tax=Alkalicoccobacillus plakortidis TaxID=444060 RepID=A0ABT0XPV2_9BACI|nr:DUF3139 domain-containing protein [Alkalicoccobacillus plakortidis]MCM2677901.1 DUF3139 domain-containing protein [Alkalicoccobacillus plakortidis]